MRTVFYFSCLDKANRLINACLWNSTGRPVPTVAVFGLLWRGRTLRFDWLRYLRAQGKRDTHGWQPSALFRVVCVWEPVSCYLRSSALTSLLKFSSVKLMHNPRVCVCVMRRINVEKKTWLLIDLLQSLCCLLNVIKSRNSRSHFCVVWALTNVAAGGPSQSSCTPASVFAICTSTFFLFIYFFAMQDFQTSSAPLPLSEKTLYRQHTHSVWLKFSLTAEIE